MRTRIFCKEKRKPYPNGRPFECEVQGNNGRDLMHIRAEKVTINIYGKTPDLPRMVWPGEQATEEDVSIIPPKIDTSAGHDDDVDMTPEDVPEPELGQAWLIDYKGTHYEAVYWYSQLHAHWSFTTSREGLTTINSRDATPVSRLIPEGKA